VRKESIFGLELAGEFAPVSRSIPDNAFTIPLLIFDLPFFPSVNATAWHRPQHPIGSIHRLIPPPPPDFHLIIPDFQAHTKKNHQPATFTAHTLFLSRSEEKKKKSPAKSKNKSWLQKQEEESEYQKFVLYNFFFLLLLLLTLLATSSRAFRVRSTKLKEEEMSRN